MTPDQPSSVIGQLNGISGVPGTIIGYHKRTEKFIAIAEQDEDGCTIRYATSREVASVGINSGVEPRSITEHYGITRQMTPFGLVRQWHKADWQGFKNETPPSPRIRKMM